MKTRAELEQENAQIKAQLARKDSIIDQLKEALILERNRKFAAATESLRSLQSELFNEPEQDASSQRVKNNPALTTTLSPYQRINANALAASHCQKSYHASRSFTT